jgi:hypothetical protein
MKRFNVLAFASGCLAAGLVAWIAPGVRAQSENVINVCVEPDGIMRLVNESQCPSGQERLYFKKPEIEVSKPDDQNVQSDSPASLLKVRIAELERQVKNLEDAALNGDLGNRVVAPFSVIDREGKLLFLVDRADGMVKAEVYNAAGESVAVMAGTSSGGQFSARSGSSGGLVTHFGINGSGRAGLQVLENGEQRVELGRDPVQGGNYRLRVLGKGQRPIASIGQNSEGTGLAYVADTQGQIRAMLAASGDKGGLVGIYDPSTQLSIAALAQGDAGGGAMRIWGRGGGETLVEAGVDKNGVGVVRAGPEGFKPGMGVLGLPGSYISGKR